ncbi:MAG: type I restriction-modification system subunit M [Actinobacteria bacterium]|nr:type I restriction-modification system subunit M [Actinomycetota bacterium]
MALKKSDLYGSLWKSCDELRGGMDASQYKDYILTLLFVKYVSDKAKTDPNNLIDVPAGGSFDDLVSFKGDKEIGDKINKAIGKLAEANDLQKVIDLADFNDEEKLGRGKEMQDRLTKLVSIFQDLDFRGSRAEGDDLLGDAYEYLMRHFATESGKSKGQFYTPAEVSRVMAKLIGIAPDTPVSATVYDPTCGSGSLLLKVADESPKGLTIYGQEKDNATWALAKMNMILHGNAWADIRKGDTITSPQFLKNDQLETFDFLVANPPFSTKSWSNGLEREYGRFEFGMPPAKNGDYAFLLHMLKSLKSTGRGAVILPHGVLFRGNAEAQIRKEIVRRGYIKGIIGLPPNLFYGTGIPACILVLDKKDGAQRGGIFMIDASKGFVKDGNKNRLRPRDMHKIVDVFTRQLEVPGYSRMVPLSEISNAANDYNLNIPRYVDASEPEDIQDLHAHLQGGIPERDIDALKDYWEAFPALRQKLFKPQREGYLELAVDPSNVQQTVMDAEEYLTLRHETAEVVRQWWQSHRDELVAVDSSTRPANLIESLSESLLALFRARPLINEYAVYEQLMSFWNETMHDDVALIMSEGWEGAAKPRKTIEDKDRKISETADLAIGSGRNTAKYKMDLLPPQLIVAKHFPEQQTELDELNAKLEMATQAVEEFVEENSGEEGLLSVAAEDDKITKTIAAARLREAKREDFGREEVEALTTLVSLYEVEAEAKKAVNQAAAALDHRTLNQYGKLSAEDIILLVVRDKWGGEIAQRVDMEIDALTRVLVRRASELSGRYAETLSDLDREVSLLSGRVVAHLASMGFEG